MFRIICHYEGKRIPFPEPFRTRAAAERERERWDHHAEQLRRVMKRNVEYVIEAI